MGAEILERVFRNQLCRRLAPLFERLLPALDSYRNAGSGAAPALVISLVTVFVTNLVNWLLAVIGRWHIAFADLPVQSAHRTRADDSISIGGLGLSQSAYVFFFDLVDVSEQLALAVSLLLQLIIYISSLPGGVLGGKGVANRQLTASDGTCRPILSHYRQSKTAT